MEEGGSDLKMLEWIKKIDINTRNWIDLAQDKDYWRVIVNATLNLRVHNSCN